MPDERYRRRTILLRQAERLYTNKPNLTPVEQRLLEDIESETGIASHIPRHSIRRLPIIQNQLKGKPKDISPAQRLQELLNQKFDAPGRQLSPDLEAEITRLKQQVKRW